MKTKLHIFYICVEDLGPFHTCSPVGSSVSMSLYGFRLVDSKRIFCCVLAPSGSFNSFSLPQHKISQAPLNAQLWVSASVSISFWVKPLRWQLGYDPVFKYSILLINSVRGGLPLLAWVSSWAYYWLDLSSKLAPCFNPKTSCGTNVSLLGWYPIPPLDVLPCYRWLVQAPYSLLLEVLVEAVPDYTAYHRIPLP